ncbi:MAG TPA: hypothetical protein VJT11_01780 [Nitrospiraceae bacterium]|nr:hypothetical protein [Nitrospiraceae bacterium]
MRVHPHHRGDCADFYTAPQYTARIHLDGPVTTISAMEHEAARTGRNWNDQFIYVVKVCLGDHLPDFDDERSAEDWRTLLSDCNFRFSEAEDWRSFAAMRRMTP